VGGKRGADPLLEWAGGGRKKGKRYTAECSSAAFLFSYRRLSRKKNGFRMLPPPLAGGGLGRKPSRSRPGSFRGFSSGIFLCGGGRLASAHGMGGEAGWRCRHFERWGLVSLSSGEGKAPRLMGCAWDVLCIRKRRRVAQGPGCALFTPLFVFRSCGALARRGSVGTCFGESHGDSLSDPFPLAWGFKKTRILVSSSGRIVVSERTCGRGVFLVRGGVVVVVVCVP
jgi:hypothetical protein